MAGYIGSKASVVSSGAERKKTFTITGATTSLTGLNYTVGKVHVFQNGVRLIDGTDYTATNGTTITLTVAAQSGDNVVVISQASYQVALSGIDDQSNATAITIDSSENVMVGKTSSGLSGAGISLLSTGRGRFTFDGFEVLELNRLTSDGDIVKFFKDGSNVGSIGTINGDTYIGTGDTTLLFKDGNDAIYPRDATGGARDGAIDWGGASNRFKDAYLSGGVYLGGTGSANKLDDFEQGTWSPTYLGSTGNPTITYDNETSATYIKVGKIVFIQGSIKTDAASGGSGSLYLGGLPFTSASTTSPKRKGGISVSGYQTSFSGAVKPTGGYINTAVNHVTLMSNMTTASSLTVQTTALNNTTNDNFMMFHGQYVIY